MGGSGSKDEPTAHAPAAAQNGEAPTLPVEDAKERKRLARQSKIQKQVLPQMETMSLIEVNDNGNGGK